MRLDLKRYATQLVAMILVALASFGVFVWAVYKNFAIGIQASDSQTSGGTDQVVWLWLFASFAMLVAVTVGLVVMLQHHSSARHRGLAQASLPGNDGAGADALQS
jgi:hypothetical protein